jgi:hypothetical protein
MTRGSVGFSQDCLPTCARIAVPTGPAGISNRFVFVTLKLRLWVQVFESVLIVSLKLSNSSGVTDW